MRIKMCMEVITIKNKLLEIRKKVGISQQELAERANVSRNTIVKIENDEDAIITTETIDKLAKALGVKSSDIFLF